MSEPRDVGSVGSDRSVRAPFPRRLRPSGGYRRLRSFQAATVIYDATVSFCERFLDPRSRTVDQMTQAARSGRQNIAEGSRASASSSQTELRLVNVARARLDELLLDYEDFLRQRGLPLWARDDPRAQAVREVSRSLPSDPSDRTLAAHAAAYAPWLKIADPAVTANAAICLVHQANFLLDRQIAGLERSFVRDGGYSETLAAARLAERRLQNQADRSDLTDRTDKTSPLCPLCGGNMALRTARKGPSAGERFWGCRGFPACRGIRPYTTGSPPSPTPNRSPGPTP